VVRYGRQLEHRSRPRLSSRETAAPPPAAQELDLTCGTLLPQALAQPSMPRLRSLSFSGDGGGPVAEPLVAALWAAPWLSQLRELNLASTRGFGSAGLAPLRGTPLLRKLCIHTSGPPTLAAGDGRALAAAPLPELRELQISDVGRGVVEALAAAPWLAWLEELEVYRDDGPTGSLAAAAGRALAGAPLQSLRRLKLVGVEPGFMAACSAAAWLTRLAELDVQGEGGLLGTTRGARGAARFAALASLELAYGATAPPSEAARFAALMGPAGFGPLRSLSLNGCPLGTADGHDGAGLRAMAAASLPNLASLSLAHACLSAADVAGVLARAPWLATLTSLELASNDLGAPGHRALSLLRLPRLRKLSLRGNGFDGASLAALVTAPWLTQLDVLSLTEEVLASEQSCADIAAAIQDEAWVFGRLRRLGCTVQAHVHEAADSPSDDDDWATDDELQSDELESGDGSGSDGEPGDG
jgi:hypothetical protein